MTPMPIPIVMSGGGGYISGLEYALIVLLVLYATYLFMVIMQLSMHEYKSKKEFLKDICIPFRKWGKSLAKEFNKLKD